jgi:PAS domain S-box-containing protein
LAFFDTGIRYQRINQWLANRNGLPVEAHIGHTPSELLPNLDEVAAVRMFHHIMETRQPVEFEASVPMDGGQISHWIASYYPVLLNDELLGVGAVTIDITERKQAEERTKLLQQVTAALSKSVTPEEVADAFIQIVPPALGGHRGVLGLISDDGTVLEMIAPSSFATPVQSAYQRQAMDAPLPLVEAIRLNQMITLESASEWRHRYPDFTAEMLAETGIEATVVLPLTVADHTLGAMAISFPQPMPLLAQEADFYTALAQQCAQAMERALLYRTEAAARAAAEEANAIKLKFLAMISHELRTPLTSIKGFAGSLLAPDIVWEADKQREFLKIIDEESDKLADLVEQLLDVSRLQAGTLRISPAPHALDRIIMIAMPQIEALASRHTLETRIANDLPSVQADHHRIAQVLVNLVGNAAKYSPSGTTIRVDATPQDGFVCIEVSDEGEGIPAEKRAVVFEPFHQLEKRARQRGAGLGLAICKGLVEAHGGRIWIQERPGPGTTMCFTLPVAEQH